MWMASIWLAPEKSLTFLVSTNVVDSVVFDEAVVAMLEMITTSSSNDEIKDEDTAIATTLLFTAK